MAKELLTELGIKVTKQRLGIIAALESAKGPITAEEIYKYVAKEEKVNFSTVYRTLNMLCDKGIIIKSGVPGDKTCFGLKGTHHHAHEIECTACHKQITIEECPMEAFSMLLNKETGFIVTEHQIEIKGLCKECAQRQIENKKNTSIQ